MAKRITDDKKGGVEFGKFRRNIMGTLSFEFKLPNMRKMQDFSVYPATSGDTSIMMQSGTRIGRIDMSNGAGIMSQSHPNGAYGVHLQFDKLVPFFLTDDQLSALKEQLAKTAGSSVGSSVVKSDNSGADKFAKGGKPKQHSSDDDDDDDDDEGEYEVRLQNPDNGEIETITVNANNSEDAQRRALEESGFKGWEVFSIQKVDGYEVEYAKGGKLKPTYIPNENIESIKTRFGQTFRGKDVLDGAYVKGEVKTPKVARYMFEEEEYEYADGGTMGSSMSAQGGGVIFQVGDMVKIMPNYSSHYTNSKGEIIKVMPDNKTYEVKIKHKTGNEYVKFDISELVFLGNQKKYADGGLFEEGNPFQGKLSGTIIDVKGVMYFVGMKIGEMDVYNDVYEIFRAGSLQPMRMSENKMREFGNKFADGGTMGSSTYALEGFLNEVPDRIYLVTIIVTDSNNDDSEHIFWGLEVRTQSGDYVRYIQNAYDFLNFRSTLDSKDIKVMRDYNQEADRTKTNEIIDGLVMTEIPPIYTSYSNVQHYGGAEEGGWYYHTREAIEEVTEAQYLEIESERLDSYGEGISASEGFIFGEDEKLGREYYS